MSSRAQGEACVFLAISPLKMRATWRRYAHFENAYCTRILCTIYFIKLGILSGPRRGVRAFGNQHFQNARHLKEVSRILKVLIAQDFSALFYPQLIHFFRSGSRDDGGELFPDTGPQSHRAQGQNNPCGETPHSDSLHCMLFHPVQGSDLLLTSLGCRAKVIE